MSSNKLGKNKIITRSREMCLVTFLHLNVWTLNNWRYWKISEILHKVAIGQII